MGEGFVGTLGSLKHVFMWIFSCMEHLLVFVLAFFISVFTEYQDMIRVVLAFSVVDWILAVSYNFIHKTIESKKMLKFIGKIVAYGIGFMTAYVFHTFLEVDALENLITSVILLAEIGSTIANGALLFPNNKLLKFLSKFVEKEKKSKMKSV